MRRARRFSRGLLPGLAIIAALIFVVSRESGSGSGNVAVLFSPGGGCQARIVAEIARAQQSIKVQAYSFTNVEIARALLAAQKRGVEVEAVLDGSNRTDRYSAATFLANQGIPCLIDDEHAIAHSKIIIIDDRTVITGSYNFTRAAEERNAENLLVLTGMPDVARQYVENWRLHRSHSQRYTGPTG